MTPPPRPHPEARILSEADSAPAGTQVWIYEGVLEQFTGGAGPYPFRQRVAWPRSAAFAAIRELGLWMTERLSVNGHLLIGLRVRREGEAPEQGRLITPGTE